jgi:hypothetical protein
MSEYSSIQQEIQGLFDHKLTPDGRLTARRRNQAALAAPRFTAIALNKSSGVNRMGRMSAD